MKKVWASLWSFSLMLLAFSVGASDDVTDPPKSNYQAWQQNRLENLKKPHGWLSLVGMEWLYAGDNGIGSADDNDIQLSKGPAHIGRFVLHSDQTMRFVPAGDSPITANDQPVKKAIDVFADSQAQGATLFAIGSYQFYVIDRQKMALRIKDSEAKTRTEFQGLEYFPEQQNYRVQAQFIPYQPVKIIQTINVMGQLYDEPSPGRLEFTLNGQKLSLDAFDGGDAYYLVFGDKTNGHSTYGPGRFLYSDGLVNSDGYVTLDFNKAYNPPCAFTAYSTCTLPPLQNRLNTAVKSGEKKYGNHKY